MIKATTIHTEMVKWNNIFHRQTTYIKYKRETDRQTDPWPRKLHISMRERKRERERERERCATKKAVKKTPKNKTQHAQNPNRLQQPQAHSKHITKQDLDIQALNLAPFSHDLPPLIGLSISAHTQIGQRWIWMGGKLLFYRCEGKWGCHLCELQASLLILEMNSSGGTHLLGLQDNWWRTVKAWLVRPLICSYWDDRYRQ